MYNDFINFHLAALLVKEERYQDAVRCLQALLGGSPDFPGAARQLVRAEALMRGEDPDAAEASTEEEGATEGEE